MRLLPFLLTEIPNSCQYKTVFLRILCAIASQPSRDLTAHCNSHFLVSDLHAGGSSPYLACRTTTAWLHSSCVWTAELWVIPHLQALKPRCDKYKAFVASSFGACLFIYLFYSLLLSEVISAALSRSSSLRSISLFCLSLREHRYHRASGPAGNLDCGGGNGCLRLQTEAEVSK